MCIFKSKAQSVEEIIASNSAGMTDQQKAEYWYELSQTIFSLLGKVEVDIINISVSDWINIVQAQYPTLTDIKIADSQFYTVSLINLQAILTKDWTNLVPYVAEISDCDKFGTRLYSHLCDYYKINAVVPVWGNTDGGYHGFNLAVVKDGNALIARLIEPQTDSIFIDQGPLGKYIPMETATELGIKRIAST
jgi:hypothetical protein